MYFIFFFFFDEGVGLLVLALFLSARTGIYQVSTTFTLLIVAKFKIKGKKCNFQNNNVLISSFHIMVAH